MSSFFLTTSPHITDIVHGEQNNGLSLAGISRDERSALFFSTSDREYSVVSRKLLSESLSSKSYLQAFLPKQIQWHRRQPAPVLRLGNGLMLIGTMACLLDGTTNDDDTSPRQELIHFKTPHSAAQLISSGLVSCFVRSRFPSNMAKPMCQLPFEFRTRYSRTILFAFHPPSILCPLLIRTQSNDGLSYSSFVKSTLAGSKSKSISTYFCRFA